MKLTLKNSLETKSVENMLVSVDTGNLQINIEDDSTQTGTMILALASRHRVERPATRMEGGTKNPMERLTRRRLLCL